MDAVRFRGVVDASLGALEARLRIVGAAIVVGVILMGLAAFYVTPTLEPVFHGAHYRDLSVTVFELSGKNPMTGRILTPLIARLLFLQGERYVVVPLLFGALFLASIYGHTRAAGASPLVALLTSGVMAASSPIVTTLKFPGYVDTTSYFLLLWALAWAGRGRLVCAVPYALSLINHESNLFALLILLAFAGSGGGWRFVLRLVAPLGAALGALVAWRYYLSSHGVASASAQGYLSLVSVRWNALVVERFAFIGAFMAFRLFWFLPLAVLIVRPLRDRATSWVIAVSIIAACGQLVLAADSSRLLALAFPAILVAVQRSGVVLTPARLEGVLGALVLATLLTPHYVVMPQGLVECVPVPVAIFEDWVGVSELWKNRWFEPPLVIPPGFVPP